MTKTELISAVADKTDFTKKNAETAVNAIIATITDALASGEKVSIVGFGHSRFVTVRKSRSSILRLSR